MSSATRSRRAFLKASAAAGGGLLLGFSMPFAGAAAGEAGEAEVFAPNAFIRIDRSGKITLIMPQAEMGQGVYTALAMILAEELDAAFDQVTLQAAPPSDKLYANPIFGIQVTGNSNSIRSFWMSLRKAGAGARALLVQAAAQEWKVDPATCRTARSEVLHDASSRRLAYAALVDRAAGMTPPPDPPLKPVADFSLIGKPLKRLDTPDKVNGARSTASTLCRPASASPRSPPAQSSAARSGMSMTAGPKPCLGCAAGRRRGRFCRRDRRSHVGGKARARRPRRSPGTKAPTPRSRRIDVWQQIRGSQRKRRRGRQTSGRRGEGPERKATGSTPLTSCPSWRMRRWSR